MNIFKLTVLWLVSGATGDATVDYYEELINREIGRANIYRFPTDAEEFRSRDEETIAFGSFDFVVIGSGSGGAVVTSRLSENRNWTVLLLEAGGEESNFSEIPGMSDYVAKLEYNWGFSSTRQATCCLDMVHRCNSSFSPTNGICPYPRGKSLGGTTAINVLVYARGNKMDYAQWSEKNRGWGYQDVLPYFRKSENCRIEGDEGYHGYGGYLNVEYHSPTSPKVDIFLQACEELGAPMVDFNGINQLGASRNQFNTIDGRRHSSYKAFLKPFRARSNLQVATNSYVTKIRIDTSKTASGVFFTHKKIKYFVKAKKEVILSAGVVGSPQILMHSGIGPKRHLQQLKIPVVADLPVGLNMHDQLTFFNIYFTTSITDPTNRDTIAQYLHGFGPLTIATNPQAIAFFKLSTRNDTVPDIEVVFIPTVPRYSKPISQLVVVLLHPKTRGRILLQSNDPFLYPLIDSKCLADDGHEDIENLYRGIEKVMELFATDAFKRINATLLPHPKCVDQGFRSREYWMCLIPLTAMNGYHGGGTCSMGPIVDHHLKVHGIRNLRVADASVIPITLSGHMSAPTMMVGERAADFIKDEYGF